MASIGIDRGIGKTRYQNYRAFLYWLFFLLGLAWTLYLYLSSPGAPVQDEIGHYLLSRNAWQYPQHLLNLWGRPLRTLVYLIPARGGLDVARLASLMIACVTVLVTTKVAHNLQIKRLFLIPAFLWFQPWFHDLSYTVIPQVLFSLLLVSATYFWCKKQYTYSSIAFGLLFLTRLEGIALLGIWLIYLCYHRRWVNIIITIIPLLFFNVIYFVVLNKMAFEIFLSPNSTTIYGSGSWFHFVLPTAYYVGIPLSLLSFVGIIPLILRKQTLLTTYYVAYFLVHTIIYRFGLFASGGYYLFMLPLAPGFAILAAMGMEYTLSLLGMVFQPVKTQARRLNAVLAVMVSIVVLWGLRTKLRPLDIEGQALKQAYEWIQKSNLVYPKIISTHFWFYYFADIPITPGKGWDHPPVLATLPLDTLVIWDRHYSNRRGISRSELLNPTNGWQQLAAFKDGIVVIFQKRSNSVSLWRGRSKHETGGQTIDKIWQNIR